VNFNFSYEALPMRVVFGVGATERVGAEVDALGLKRVAVLCTPGGAELGRRVADALGPRCAEVVAEARMHVPIEVVDRAVARVAAVEADGCVTVGGGSAIGLGKAIALRTGLPIVAIPTTYAGSEMTPVWGLTENGRKTTGRDRAVLPRSVVYDPALTLSLPPRVSLTSGVNAMAHAAEALYAPDLTPLIGLQAEEGVRALAAALPRVVADPADPGARAEALYGAWLCGTCLGATTTGLHHKLCHALGGALDLPHAETHAVVLPYVLAYNASADNAPAAMVALSRALGTDDPIGALRRLTADLGGPTSLAELGMPESAVDSVAEVVAGSPFPNPRPVTRDAVAGLLRDALRGRNPMSAD
jgi:maleylacetate reductase